MAIAFGNTPLILFQPPQLPDRLIRPRWRQRQGGADKREDDDEDDIVYGWRQGLIPI